MCLLLPVGCLEIRLASLGQAFDVGVVAGNGETCAEDGEDKARRAHMEEEGGRHDGDRPAQGANRHFFRQQRACEERAHGAQPDAPVDAEADRAADRDALAALEVVQHREAVAQYAAARAETQADLSGQCFARQHAHGGLGRVSGEGQQSRAPAVYARHVGGARVAAALLANVAAEESLGGENRKTQRTDEERADKNHKRFPNQGEDLLRLCTIIL